jgi:predicted heme/steroid binding protein/predicted small secreted protein
MKRLIPILFVLVFSAALFASCSSGGGTQTDVQETQSASVSAEESAQASSSSASPSQETASSAAAEDSGELVLTLEELAAYNGKDGMPAYVAVDGVIYDVTDVPEWSGGDHNGFSAGNDLTEQIKTVSPHGVAKLTGVPVVGRLAD